MRVIAILGICIIMCGIGAIADPGIDHLSIIPQQGEGIYQMLRRYGLKANQMGYQAFCNLNAPLLGESESLFPDREYRLPVIVASFGESYESVLAKLGVSSWRDEIFVYNQLFNNEFTADRVDVVPPDQVLYVPELRSGFYELGDGIEPVPASYVQESLPVAEYEGLEDIHIPYPDIKDRIISGEMGSELSGLCFILDPGHGGDDPGTNPFVQRGDGLEAHAFEAPLVYDVTLRLLKHIRLHGGEVYLTHYSPDFGIRDEKNPQEYHTQKYNLSSQDITRDSPAQSIRARKAIAGEIITRNYHKGRRTIFLSIHADYLQDKTRDLPITFYYHRLPGLDGSRSKNLAINLSRAVTGSAENVKAQGLGVLYKNPSDYELLIELANLNNKNGAWRLRDHTYREKLARIVCGGLIAAFD